MNKPYFQPDFARILFLTMAELLTRLRPGQHGFATDTNQYVIRDPDGAFHVFGAAVPTNMTRVIASPYNVLVTDDVIFVDTDGGAITVNLPAGVLGKRYRVTNCGSSGNDVTLAPNGLELLVGANASVTLIDSETLEVFYETTEGWF